MRRHVLQNSKNAVTEKIREASAGVLPIVAIVLLLCLSIAPVPVDLLLRFFIGTLMILLGMGLFSLGSETSMTPIGSLIGTNMTKTRKIPLILAVTFALGFAVTVAEPDLQVLAQTVPHIRSSVLLITVGVGVGFFLCLCMIRIFTGIRLRLILLISYAVVFLLAAFCDDSFSGIAFDSGGVTTGPMTVPFILALGVGVSNIRSDVNAEADSFGLVALSSIGPILSVLLLGFFYRGGGAVLPSTYQPLTDSSQVGMAYFRAMPHSLAETAVALLPVLGIFLLFQVFLLKLHRRPFLKIAVGLLYTYCGLVLFLTGVNVGFADLGRVLGEEMSRYSYLLIPLSALLGWFIISAEPAVAVLEKQIEDVSAGAIPGRVIRLSLSVAVALSMALSMLRILTGIPILWFLIPGYAIALILSFFVPDIFTAIAFDSGGVASGPMTATFMLQFFIGVCSAVGGNVLQDAFGAVAMVAMMPLISIQTVGFLCRKKAARPAPAPAYGDREIVELWEDAA